MSNSKSNNIATFAVFALRYVAYAGVLVCAVGLITAIQKFYPLWINPIRTEGTISGYSTTTWQSRKVFGGALTSSASANLPVITFQNEQGESFTFADNFGHDRLLKPGEKVAVIYQADHPANAIADKGLLNWTAIYIWIFGLAASVLGALRFRNLRNTPM